MNEEQVDALFARYVEHLVVNGACLDLEELAAGDAEVVAALRERVLAFQRIDDALGRELQPLSGRTLGRYEIHEKLGAGGMGEVYRAVDKDLGRDVAVKVLPPLLAWNPERRTRFEREARILATLDHRNIGAIHGLERADGLLFLVLELVPGETLQERIARGPLPLEEALLLFRQVALALEAAHAKGIIHRDLKPANVKVTPDGTVKLLDFGLGKTFGALEPAVAGGAHEAAPVPEAIARSFEQTVTGLVLGTAAYMSPEQAQGVSVDQRADIFSFGVLLQEMLTGKNPFTRATWAETRAAILGEPAPRVSASRRDIAHDALSTLQLVLDKCLAKGPGDRYQGTADLLVDLEAIGSESRKAVAGTARRRRSLVAASGVGVLLAGVLAYRVTLRREPVPVLSNPVPVTRAVGAEEYPTWSPDGGRLAFGLNTRGDEASYDIWVVPASGGEATNLTLDNAGMDRYPSWSPDGSQVAFWSDRQGGGYFVMSALGGPARKVAGGAPSFDTWWGWWATTPQWSRNGQELASVAYERDAAFLQVVSLASGESRRIVLPGRKRSRLDPSWSPDQRYVAYLEAANRAPLNELRVLRVEDHETLAVTDGRSGASSPFWSFDGRHLYFVSNRGGSSDLWRQRMRDGRPAGDPERVTTGIGMTSAALSQDGKRLAYSRGRSVANLWRVPIIEDRPATWVDAQQITFDDTWIGSVDVSRDGKRLLVDSDRAGNGDLWMLPVDGGEMQPVTTDPMPDEQPAWSPDGSEVAFSALRSGNAQIWVQGVAGGPPRQLTEGEGHRNLPAWSPDGRTLVYTSRGSSGQDLWTLPAAGGVPRQLTAHPSDDRRGSWSPDGKWLVFSSSRLGGESLWRAPSDGGTPVLLTKDGYAPVWSRDGLWIYYVSVADRNANLWAVAADGRTKRPMTDLRGRRGGAGPNQCALAADASYLYFIWQEDLGDIWVADVTYPGRWD